MRIHLDNQELQVPIGWTDIGQNLARSIARRAWGSGFALNDARAIAVIASSHAGHSTAHEKSPP
jgi:hypothetical protein